MFDFVVGRWVLDLYLVSFPYVWSGTGMTGLLGMVIVYILMLYSKLVLIGSTSFAGRTEM